MTVEHKRLGNHGTIVSNLCLGTVNFGTVTSEKESFAIMDRALELGINFFDTADVYIDMPEKLGRAVQLESGFREKIQFIAIQTYTTAAFNNMFQGEDKKNFFIPNFFCYGEYDKLFYQKQKVISFKSRIDDRYSQIREIVTHNFNKIPPVLSGS